MNMVKALQACQNTLRIRTPPFFNEIRSLKKKASHPPLPSQSHKGRDGQQRSFQFPASITSYLRRARRRGAWD